ncbi:hypothetical protein F5Y17DRAFT_434309 [Xylariaceae sp. FL0594]|nr:hypothetical protein F5Y17DRAFT_434309 [Xylariaceae sp. FL0594]
MCYNHVYTEVVDGRMVTRTEPEICPERCYHYATLNYKHAKERSPSLGPSHSRGYPPTPPLSHYSDYTSDSDRSSKRRSGLSANDHHILEVNGQRYARHERQHSGEHHYHLSSSPLSPLHHHYSRPVTPTSPAYDDHERGHHRRSSSSHSHSSHRSSHRSSHHSGPSLTVNIVTEQPKPHRRQGSSSKTSSRPSHDEERRPRRSSLAQGDQMRLSKKEMEIERQNRAIKERPTIPTTPYRRPSVSVTPPLTPRERAILKEQEDAKIREKEQRKREKEQRAREKRRDEEQLDRLKDRFDRRQSYYY